MVNLKKRLHYLTKEAKLIAKQRKKEEEEGIQYIVGQLMSLYLKYNPRRYNIISKIMYFSYFHPYANKKSCSHEWTCIWSPEDSIGSP